MSYILLLVFSSINLVPKAFTVSEFQSKSACEIALREAKTFYRTVNEDSKCISVEDEVKKAKLKEQLNKLTE